MIFTLFNKRHYLTKFAKTPKSVKKGLVKNFFLLFLLFVTTNMFSYAEFREESSVLQTATGSIYGTLLLPKVDKIFSVAILISGSGPTDRNGNQPKLQNNSLKMLANALASHGIASLRYDKRAIGQSRIENLSEEDLRFEDYIDDAVAWAKWLKEKGQFNQIVVIGHSEGSLIGIIASQKGDVDKFISLAGPGRSADKLLKEQLGDKTILSYFAFPLIDDLVQGKSVKAPFFLKTLFRGSVQPYLISWFKYDPSVEISKLAIPCLVVQGTNDIQVTVEDAKQLTSVNNRIKLKIINGMNHVLKNTKLDKKENIKSYNQPDLPINKELINELVYFINL